MMRKHNWPTLLGYGLFIGMMAVGYYYNVTFIQLGLTDLGGRVIGMSEVRLAMAMAVLALITCMVALAFGLWMRRQAWSTSLVMKLRLAFLVVMLQTILTAVAPSISSEGLFLAWIALASLALGIGVPVTFSMTVDLVAVRHRGYVAALITAVAYFAAPVFSPPWLVEHLAMQMLGVMAASTLGLGVLAFVKLPFIDELAKQHTKPEFGRGRFARSGEQTRIDRRLLGLIVAMFGIFFVDSLGFLRLVETPVYMASAWLSPDVSVRLFIGVTHVVAALIAGILYTNFNVRHLFLWIFGIFALMHLMYLFHVRSPFGEPPLTMPMLYAMTVSLYTVVNFAIWADVSTPKTISFNAALGVALSGWTATFISTALAIQWRTAGMTLEQHLSLVNALAMLFFLAMLLLVIFPSRNQHQSGTSERRSS
jgi:MFS family permease